MCFGSKEKLEDKNIYENVKQQFPSSQIALCSTSGEIYQDTINENSLVAVALEFEKTTIIAKSVNCRDYKDSFSAGVSLFKKIPQKDLSYVMLLSEGSLVNGSELVKGISTQIDKNILITGGLAGDGANFKSTLLGLNEQPKEGEIIAIGFYGNNIQVSHGIRGGWDYFGLEKRVTKSLGNVLYELEGQNALELYKKYLGPQESENLPGSALLFPLSVKFPGANEPIVRTILSIDENDNSMTFAGDIPINSKVRFMKADIKKITNAASEAALQTTLKSDAKPNFSLIISCIGRKIVLGENVEEEIKAVGEIFNGETIIAGFYSYGEISPFNEGGNCQLHNQTMTITSFYEI